MLDYMTGEVAQAIQDDRRAQAAKRARVAEVEEAHRPHGQGARMRERRAAVAKALQALAMRLAPPAPAGTPHPGIATRATH